MDIPKFEIANTRIDAKNLIEASAGTGKTFSITFLYLRMLLEKEFSVDQILVVTFTVAATGELKSRIRDRLAQALKYYSGEKTQDDAILDEITQHSGICAKRARRLLLQAIRDFDRAKVYTILGFCNRILMEFAFETGNAFHAQLVTETGDFFREIVEDFWRNTLYEKEGLFTIYMSRKSGPQILFDNLYALFQRPGLTILPETDLDACLQEIAALEGPYRKADHAVRSIWKNEREEIISFFEKNHCLINGNVYRKTYLHKFYAAADRYADSENPVFLMLADKEDTDRLRKLSISFLRSNTKKGSAPFPEHRFFTAMDDLVMLTDEVYPLLEKCRCAYKKALLEFVHKEAEIRKTRRNVLFFEDLLFKTEKALFSKDNTGILSILQKRFKSALIDEFQDTDPVQYAIFERIFSSPAHSLFLIGDPKQAIYGFRGADIFTYMKAAEKMETRYSLDCNYRSSQELVHAVNTFFSSCRLPFFYKDIQFEKARPAKREMMKFCLFLPGERQTQKTPYENPEESLAQAEVRRTGIHRESPLVFRYFVKAEEDSSWNKDIVKNRILKDVAKEVDTLLRYGKFLFPDGRMRPVREPDIAILVYKNKDAAKMKEMLLTYRIPGVISGTDSIFATKEAQELQLVLEACSRPASVRHVVCALSTRIIGLNALQIYDLLEDTGNMETWITRFREYRSLYMQYGFYRFYREFLRNENIQEKVMGYPNGERRLTNLYHLGEMLHQKDTESGMGLSRLIEWLFFQRNHTTEADAHLLRMETDEDAVKIVTMHKSKGLEYPIVFLPFPWDDMQVRAKYNREIPVVFHHANSAHSDAPTPETNPKKQDIQYCDLGSENLETHLGIAEEEQLAENLRLLYVGMTRAVHRLYMYWGKTTTKKGPQHLPAGGYLLCPDIPGDGGFDCSSAKETYHEANDSTLLKELEMIAEKSSGTICAETVTPPPLAKDLHSEKTETPAPGTGEKTGPASSLSLERRILTRNIHPGFEVSSYTSLTGHAGPNLAEEEIRDRDITPWKTMKTGEPAQEDMTIFSFPKGAVAGVFFHTVFENLDFRNYDSRKTRQMIDESLGNTGMDPAWGSTVHDCVKKVMQTPLFREDPDFSLSLLKPEEMVKEMRFTFPAKRFSKTSLASALFPGKKEYINRLRGQYPDGFLTGAIDLIFFHQGRYHILDWKSNYLGDSLPDYSNRQIEIIMEENLYTLQYSIYLVALHKYLEKRLKNYSFASHAGDVFYVFIRGTDPEISPETGIYRIKPDYSLIRNFLDIL